MEVLAQPIEISVVAVPTAMLLVEVSSPPLIVTVQVLYPNPKVIKPPNAILPPVISSVALGTLDTLPPAPKYMMLPEARVLPVKTLNSPPRILTMPVTPPAAVSLAPTHKAPAAPGARGDDSSTRPPSTTSVPVPPVLRPPM